MTYNFNFDENLISCQVFIGKDLFNLDYVNKEIYQVQDHTNSYSFKGKKATDGFYMLHQDFSTLRLESHSEIRHAFEETIKIPEQLLMGPIKNREILDYFRQLCFDYDYGIVPVNDTLKYRLMGQLPVLKIGKDDYYVDVRIDELRHTKDIMVSLPIQGFHKVGKNVWAIYHPDKKELLILNKSNFNNIPEGYKYIEFDNFLRLDPVAHGYMIHGEPTHYLNSSIQLPNPTAKMEPIDTAKLIEIMSNDKKLDWIVSNVKNREIKDNDHKGRSRK